MAQHPQPPTKTTQASVTVQRTVTAPVMADTSGTPASPAAGPPPTPVTTTTASPGAALAAQRLADLTASLRDIAGINPLTGVVSGPGNNGSSNTANLQGHSGTAASFIGLPRAIGGPGPGGGTPN